MTNKTKFYKLRHKETGRYYQTRKGRFGHDITNLGPNGKIYYKIPNPWEHIGVYTMQIPNPNCGKIINGWIDTNKTIAKTFNFKKEDFEIVEFTVVETVLKE